jgi:putative ubiquitin-RnfH superfamily antitoxin RatB of RatAB toxin-antitoxin module
MAPEMTIQVTIVYSPTAREVMEVSLVVAPGCTLLMALQASGLLQLFPAIDQQTTLFGIWGRTVGLDQLLQESDRIELYRPLTVDPKVARRERFAKQGARTTGLFRNKRAGAATGY